MTDLAPTNGGDWMRRQERDVRLLGRRANPFPLIKGLVQTGTIALYYTDGRVDVTINGELHRGLRFIGEPPYGAAEVSVVSLDGELLVLGAKRSQGDVPRQHPLPGPDHSEWYSVDGQFGEMRFTKSSAGWVTLSGLIYTPTVTHVTGLVLAVLPVGFRPLRDAYFVSYSGTTGGTYWISASTGEIRISVPAAGVTLMSLDGIQFTANTDLVWTYPAVTPPWVPRVGQEPRWAVDPAGRVILEGWIQGGGPGQTAFALPVGVRPTEGNDIFNGVNNNGGMYSLYVYGAASASTVTPQANAVAGGVSLLSSWYPGTDGWRRIQVINGGQYGSGFRIAAIRKMSDNIIAMKGLIFVNTGSVKLFGVPNLWAPSDRKIFSPRATDGTGRMDLYRGTPTSIEPIMAFITGIGSWVSLSSFQWPQERIN